MKPVICNYYLTCRCNARCSFCNIWNDEHIPASEESPVEIVCRNLSDARSLGVKIVDFTGGEPLLYEGIYDVLRYAKKIGLKTTITTNGIIYPERAEEIAGLIDILQFSLDAANKDGHDSVKGVPSFDRVMESIGIAHNLRVRPTFIHTVTDENISSVPDVMALARKMNVLLFLNPCFSYFDNNGLSRKNAITLGEMAHGKGVTVDRGFLKFFIDGGNKRDKPRCLAVTSTIVISPDDKLVLPCFHAKTLEIPIEGRLTELRNSTSVEFEKKIEGHHPFCEGCTVYCYIRASLFRRFDRYVLPSYISAAHYLFELHR
ncbi:MAG TPA: radical SAM protein [bacterium]|nr:radical SAM protein [bacterium]